MYTKNDLKNQLKNMGLTGNETILIHFLHLHGKQ